MCTVWELTQISVDLVCSSEFLIQVCWKLPMSFQLQLSSRAPRSLDLLSLFASLPSLRHTNTLYLICTERLIIGHQGEFINVHDRKAHQVWVWFVLLPWLQLNPLIPYISPRIQFPGRGPVCNGLESSVMWTYSHVSLLHRETLVVWCPCSDHHSMITCTTISVPSWKGLYYRTFALWPFFIL